MTWNPSDPGYTAPKFIVKNLLELKEGQRILIEGNVLQNVWGGFTQTGNAILVTPKNQGAAGGTNVCPICLTSDVTFRFNYVSHVGPAMQIAFAPSGQGWAAGGYNYSIHDMIFDGVQYSTCYQCGSYVVQLSSGYSPTNPPPSAMHDISIDHITLVSARPSLTWLLLGGPYQENPTNTPLMSNISITNVLSAAGPSLFYSTGNSSSNCAKSGDRNYGRMISSCWTGASQFTNNLFSTEYTTSKANWPEGNTQADSFETIGFERFSAEGGDYRLSPASPFRGVASDGKDVGADVNLVMQYIEGVR